MSNVSTQPIVGDDHDGPSAESLAEMPEIDFSTITEFWRGPLRKRRMSLRLLRDGHHITQQQVADKMGVAQAEISRFEQPGDHKVSSLRRYAEALGGELEVAIVIGDRVFRLTDIG